MSTQAGVDAALVGALFIAARDNALAMDHLIRLRREANSYAEAVNDPGAADGYIVTAVINTLAMAEDNRVESEVSA